MLKLLNFCNKVNEISFIYNFDRVLIYIIMSLLLSIDLIFLPKVHPLKCWFLPKFGLEILPKYFRCPVWFISILNMDFNMYLSQHSSDTILFSYNTHQYGSPQVSHVNYCSLRALSIHILYFAYISYTFILSTYNKLIIMWILFYNM